MNEVIWRPFKLGDLFEFSSCNTIALKKYNLSDKYIDGYIEVVTSSKDNDSNQFMNYYEIPSSCPVYEYSLTINRNGSIGYCHFHERKFIIPTGDCYALLHKNNHFKKELDKNCYNFMAVIITYLFTKTVFDYSYKVNSDRFARELILLPCLEVSKDDEYIWEDEGHYYTLAVNYIKELMDKAKEEREKNTIRLYEAERAKYEAERAKYEADYKKEKKLLVWKAFKLGDLFAWSSRKDLSLKNYNFSKEYQNGYVEVVTGSKTNENDFVCINDLPNDYPIYSNCLCLNTNGSIGYCIYYKNSIISPTSSVHVLLHKLNNLQNVMTAELNTYLAFIITKIFTSGIYSRTACLISEEKFARELILLPCLEVSKDDEYIWEDEGHYYTLAVNYISYLYLNGRVIFSQKLIDKYTYEF